jgi:hypothetical protein
MNRYFKIIVGATLVILPILNPSAALSSDAVPFRTGIQTKDSPSASQYLARLQSEGRNYLLASDDKDQPPSIDMGEIDQNNGEELKRKSPLKAFLYSAVIPGTGQLYTGSKTKAALFFGIEVLTWTGHITYYKKGDDKTKAFENFADTHWAEERYEYFLDRNWGVTDDKDPAIQPPFTHHLPDTKTQQYYEMIGKYDQFVFGWDDVDTILTPPTRANLSHAHSANRLLYEDMRHEANQMYDRGRTFLVVTIINHLIAGTEAAWAATKYNKNLAAKESRLSFRAVTAKIDDKHFPMLTLNYTF